MVGGIGFLGGQLRLDREEFALEGADAAVQVLVGGSVGIEAALPRAQHVQVHHGVNVFHIGSEGPVQEIPRPGKGITRCAETDKEDAPAKERPGIGKFLRQFQQHGHAGGVSIGSIIGTVHDFPVHGKLVCAKVVHSGSHDDIMAVLTLVPALQKADYIAGSERVRPPGNLEFTAHRKNVDAIFFQLCGKIIRRHFLAFGPGLPAFHLG